MKLTWPVPGYDVGPIEADGINYGTPEAHLERGELPAIDIPAPQGAVVVACHDALVTRVGTLGKAGLSIDLAWEEEGHQWLSRDCHLYTTINTQVGQQVFAGEVIGLVGSTGFSTGPHDHFLLYCDGVRVPDPRIYFAERVPIAPTLPESASEGADPMDTADRERIRAALDEIWGVKGVLESGRRLTRKQRGILSEIIFEAVVAVKEVSGIT